MRMAQRRKVKTNFALVIVSRIAILTIVLRMVPLADA
jgi:hypothetical protein